MNNIAFPKLGISLNISPVAFSIGSKPIYWYALIILSGFLLGLFFVYKTCEKRGVKKDNVWDIALFGLIFGSILCRPKSLPQMNCMTSFISVRNTRNNSRPRPPELNPGSSGSDRR